MIGSGWINPRRLTHTIATQKSASRFFLKQGRIECPEGCLPFAGTLPFHRRSAPPLINPSKTEGVGIVPQKKRHCSNSLASLHRFGNLLDRDHPPYRRLKNVGDEMGY